MHLGGDAEEVHVGGKQRHQQHARQQQHGKGNAPAPDDPPHGDQPAPVGPRGRLPDAVEHRFQLEEDADGRDCQCQHADGAADFRLLLDHGEKGLELFDQVGADVLLQELEHVPLVQLGLARST